MSDELLLAGTIEAEKRVDLGFAASGRVAKTNFTTGDTVKKGNIIAEISQNTLNANLMQARAQYDLTYVDTSYDASNTQSSYEKQQAEQNSVVDGLYTQYIASDLAAYSTDDKDTSKAAPIVTGSFLGKKEANYILKVYASASESGYSYRLSGLETGTYTAFTNQAAALGTKGLYVQFNENTSYANTEWIISMPNTRSSTYLARKTAYENALNTRDRIINDAKNNVDRVSSPSAENKITRTDAQRNQARAQVNAVYSQMGDGKIIAPFSGVIVKNDLEVGEIVSAFTPLVVMFENDQKKLSLNVPEIYINKIMLNDKVNITLDAYPDIRFSGVVSFIDVISTDVDGVPVYQTDITLSDTDQRIRVGMNAKARIIISKKESVIAVPSHYIMLDADGLSYVTILVEKETKKQIVEIGLQGNEGLVEIISGLSAGDILIKQT